MNRQLATCIQSLALLGAVVWLTTAFLPVLGLASAALLFLLPVLLAASRGGVWPGLVATLAGAAAYNYFLLEPRFTFAVHQLENVVSVIVLGLVALVTSRLANRLRAREAEANQRAAASGEAAALSALLAAGPAEGALEAGFAFLATHYGPASLVCDTPPPSGPSSSDAAFSSLDLSAAAWSLHNGDMTGHGTETMPAADWTFIPLTPKTRADRAVVAIARPADGTVRAPADLAQLQQLCLLLGQCRDRARLDEERRARERLEQGDRLRRTFLASLAHDFRTPLTVIAGRLELLAAREPQAADALAAARRLDRMIANLLGAARIEDSALIVVVENLDLVDVVSAACDGLPLPPGIAFDRAIPADLPFVTADPVLLQHVIGNLVDNALRHARSTVALTATPDHAGVLLHVDDDGPGVPEAERERVFRRFHRIEGGDRSDGSGLGLAIVKGFADAMAVPVTISRSPQGGARFTLSLPIAGRMP